MTTLKDKGYIINNPSGSLSSSMWNYIGPERSPSQAVSIRAIEHDKYKVIDKLNNRLLEEIEESKAFFQVYEGAVYMHQGINYLVEELNLSSRTAFCRKADLKYYTKTRDYTDINVLGGEFVCFLEHYNFCLIYIFCIIDSSPGVIFSTSFCLVFFCRTLSSSSNILNTCTLSLLIHVEGLSSYEYM